MTDTETRWTADEQRLSRLLHRAVADAEPTGPAPTATRPVAPVVDLGHRRRWSVVAVPAVAACLVAAVVAGVGLATREAPAPAASDPPRVVVHDPATLLGTWSADLRSAPGADGFSATFDEDGVQFSEDACTVGYWTATHPDGLLVMTEGASFSRGDDPCAVLGRRPWMADVTETARFVVEDDDHVVLLDRGGEQVAALTRRGGRGATLPAVGVAPLANGLEPPTEQQLAGSWFEEGLGRHGRTVTFSAETWSYSQSVPCNARTEPYALSSTGGFAHLRDPSSGVQGCNPRLPAWLTRDVARLGLDGDVLVLLDADGRQIARLDRDPVGTAAQTGQSGPGTVVDRAQGRWQSIGPQTPDGPLLGLWLEVDGDVLTHAGTANCNIGRTGYILDADGEVSGTVDAYTLGKLDVVCGLGGTDLVPGGVARIAIEGDQLVLLTGGRSEIARFMRAWP